MKTLTIELPPERFAVVSEGLVYVIGQPDTPEWRRRLKGKHFDEVRCTCGDMHARLRCVRVFFDDHTRKDKWRIELGKRIVWGGSVK